MGCVVATVSLFVSASSLSVVLHLIHVLFEPDSRPFCPRLFPFCACFVPDSCPMWVMWFYFTYLCCLVLYLYFICPFRQSVSFVCLHLLSFCCIVFVVIRSFLSLYLCRTQWPSASATFVMFWFMFWSLLSCVELCRHAASCCVFIGQFVVWVSRQLDSETWAYLSHCTLSNCKLTTRMSTGLDL